MPNLEPLQKGEMQEGTKKASAGVATAHTLSAVGVAVGVAAQVHAQNFQLVPAAGAAAAAEAGEMVPAWYAEPLYRADTDMEAAVLEENLHKKTEGKVIMLAQ